MPEATLEERDLAICDQEPIHVPGAIQPHGLLVVLREPDLTLAQVSENAVDHTGVEATALLGRRVDDVVDAASRERLVDALGRMDREEVNPVPITLGERRYDGIVHRHLGATILELEPSDPDLTGAYPALRLALHDIQGARTLQQSLEATAREVRRLTGFDRVMTHRFDEDGHGAVVAESKREGLQPYLGQRYPKTDIPMQARRLYLANWLRIIPDGRYTPARLVPERRPDTGEPLDLSHAVLRSVSPVHLEFMANMGVRATMSCSLIVRGRLWGLVSCGHESGPRFVPFELRSACEAIARLVSLQIAAFEDRELERHRADRQPLRASLVEAMREQHLDVDILDALLSQPDDLLALVGARGVAILRDGGIRSVGRAPDVATIEQIARWLDTRDEVVCSTSALSRELPAAKGASAVASGVLSFALPGPTGRRLLWFRPEQVQTVHWGGDPRKPTEVDANLRPHPRRSFDLWKEEVRGQSERWTPSELDAAEALRRDAVEIDLERQVARERRAVRAREEIVAIVSHDLRSPLTAIGMQATLLRRGAQGDDEASARLREGVDRIRRAADRMNALIRDLLDLSKIEAGRFSVEARREELDEVLDGATLVLRPLATAKGIELTEQRVDTPPVFADRERIAQVLFNLVGNAIKFTPEGGHVTLRAERRGDEVAISVADDGPGIPADQLPHVFDRYWRAGGERESSGLGLFIAKGIVEAHGGRIEARSKPGVGTVLTFTVPVAR